MKLEFIWKITLTYFLLLYQFSIKPAIPMRNKIIPKKRVKNITMTLAIPNTLANTKPIIAKIAPIMVVDFGFKLFFNFMFLFINLFYISD